MEFPAQEPAGRGSGGTRMPLANTCPILRHMSTFGHVIRPGLSPGLTQVHHRQQVATGPVSPESWPTSLASIGHCGGVQQGEIKSAPETRRGAPGGTLTGNHRHAQVTVGNAGRGRAASEQSEIVTTGLTYQAQTVTYG